MLNMDQMSNLEASKRELSDRKLILDIAVDIQTVLRLLVGKGIITRDEVNEVREKVRQSPKYKDAFTYIEQTEQQILKYENDPQSQLRDMFNMKLNGK